MAIAAITVEDTEEGINFNVDLKLKEESTSYNDMKPSQQIIYTLGEVMNAVRRPDLLHYLAIAVRDGDIVEFTKISAEIRGVEPKVEEQSEATVEDEA